MLTTQFKDLIWTTWPQSHPSERFSNNSNFQCFDLCLIKDTHISMSFRRCWCVEIQIKTQFFLTVIFFGGDQNGCWLCSWSQCKDPGIILYIWIPLSFAITINLLLFVIAYITTYRKLSRPGRVVAYHFRDSIFTHLNTSFVIYLVSVARKSLCSYE